MYDYLNSFQEDYYNEVKDFFEDYELGPAEITKIAVMLAIPNIYKIITLLRENPYEIDEFRIDFMEKYNFLPSNFTYLLRLLEKNQVVKIYKKKVDSKTKTYLLLKSDIQFQVFFPEYLVDNIRKAWRENTITKDVALKHLTFLRDEYLENFMSLNNNKAKAIDVKGKLEEETAEIAEARVKVSILERMEEVLVKVRK